MQRQSDAVASNAEALIAKMLNAKC